jgi:hypothetical protein
MFQVVLNLDQEEKGRRHQESTAGVEPEAWGVIAHWNCRLEIYLGYQRAGPKEYILLVLVGFSYNRI